jgi:hypothetical protein
MMNYSNLGTTFPIGMGLFGAWIGMFLVPLILWSLVWKGWALWRAAKNDSKVWFVVLLILNTAGILDILYIFVFGKKKSHPLKTKK